jgi:GntR family transcriptional regulator
MVPGSEKVRAKGGLPCVSYQMKGAETVKLPIDLSEDSREPMYHQIEAQIKALIVSGYLKPGSPLPSIRSLAKDLSCSVITTGRAYNNLEQQGYIKSAQGKGTFVADMDSAKIAEAKRATVMRTLERAVQTALQHDYRAQDIQNMVADILRKRGRSHSEGD